MPRSFVHDGSIVTYLLDKVARRAIDLTLDTWNVFQLSVERNSHLLWFCFGFALRLVAKFAPLPQPMRSKTKTNCYFLARVFSRLAPVA